MKPLLSTRALEIRTATAQLVEPLSIDLWPGKVLTIIGETGSGKSLFAQGIVGNLPPGLSAHGEIELAGPDDRMRSATSQSPRLFGDGLRGGGLRRAGRDHDAPRRIAGRQ